MEWLVYSGLLMPSCAEVGDFTSVHAGGVPLYFQLRAGIAGILLDGLTGDSTFYTTPEDAASTSRAAEASSADDRAELVLQLLLSGLDGAAPNVGHMLLGFDAEHGPEGV